MNITLDNIKSAIFDRVAGGCTEGIGTISDGYHTFDELYEHRNQLFVSLCKAHFYIWHEALKGGVSDPCPVYKTTTHADGTPTGKGWFLLALDYNKSPKQITYHLPESFWEQCAFAPLFDQMPYYDGHTSADVLERLKQL